MPAKRITMRKIRDVLRLRLCAGLSIRQIKASTKLSVGAIQKLLSKAETLGLAWPLPPELDDKQLARLFYPDADTHVSGRYQVPGRNWGRSGLFLITPAPFPLAPFPLFLPFPCPFPFDKFSAALQIICRRARRYVSR